MKSNIKSITYNRIGFKGKFVEWIIKTQYGCLLNYLQKNNMIAEIEKEVKEND